MAAPRFFPWRKEPIKRGMEVEDHAEYLEQRWNEGCHNATTLFREIRLRGYKKGRSMVARYVRSWRKNGPTKPQPLPKRIAPKRAAILACRPATQLSRKQDDLFNQLMTNCPDLRLMRALAEDFRTTLFGGDSSALLQWMGTVVQCGIGPLTRFAFGLKKDLNAVSAAIDTGWNNGQVEGQVNRLKMIKRQMYGRAGFQLLRSRVLPFPSSASP
jgi:transposase